MAAAILPTLAHVQDTLVEPLDERATLTCLQN